MIKWVCAALLLACCSPWLWAQADSGADSSTEVCLENERWQRLTSIFHEAEQKLTTCEANLNDISNSLSKLERKHEKALATQQQESETLQKATASLPAATPPPARGIEWWHILIGAGTCLAGILGDGALDTGGILTVGGCGAGGGFLVGVAID